MSVLVDVVCCCGFLFSVCCSIVLSGSVVIDGGSVIFIGFSC